MTQFRQEVSASEKANVTAIGDISAALEATLAQEREKAEQERHNLTAEIQRMINTMVENQQGRWTSAVDHVKQDLSASQGRVQGGFQLVSKGLDSWQERESAFSKKLLNNKEDVKKSIVEASKVISAGSNANCRLLISAGRQFKIARDAFMLRLLSSWILR